MLEVESKSMESAGKAVNLYKGSVDSESACEVSQTHSPRHTCQVTKLGAQHAGGTDMNNLLTK